MTISPGQSDERKRILLVADCNMPGMTGLKLARACSGHNRSVGVLYISGSQPDEELQADLKTHRRAFLPKPFRGDDLLRKTRELLAPGFEGDNAPAPAATSIGYTTDPLHLKRKDES